jgi:TonB-linked SusC/RagA family outer membrane protein
MRKHWYSLLWLCLAVCQLHAQTKSATGTVTDEKGTPLPAVTVTALTSDRKVVSTTVTDINGVFKLSFSENAKTLQFTYIGLEEQFLPIGGRSGFTITMKTGSKNLSEVVVVGYGSQRKSEVTGSVASVKGAAIAETPVQSFEASLAGRSSGVQITVPSGIVNEPPVFRVRGTNSISLSSYPLVIIDGVPSFTGDYTSGNASANPLSSVNPNDIESIDIAKDAAATAIYGSRASNGVVFITTKKGKSGRAKVTYDGWGGWNKAYGVPKMLNADQYIQFKTMAVANNPSLTGTSAISFKYAKNADSSNVNTNWADYVYRTGFSHSHNVNVSGGNDATTYYLSTGYTTQEGIVRKNDFKRINILANVDTRLNKAISLGGKASYSNEQNLSAGSSGSLNGEAYNTGALTRLTMVLPSILAPYNPDGSYNVNGSAAGSSNITGISSLSYPNPIPILNLSRSNNEVNHIQSNVYLQVKPLSWITLKTLYGIDYLLIDNDAFLNPVNGDGYTPNGTATATSSKNKTWLWTNTAQFDYTFGEKHNFSLLAGNEQQRRTSATWGIQRQGVSDPNYNVIQAGFTVNNPANNSKGENYLLSNFGRLNYNFDKKYFLAGTLRRDEYSALGQKAGIFYGASAGWEIAQENFWKSVKLDHVFSSFRIRGSYGKVGNINGIGDFSPYNQYYSGLYGGAATLSYALGTVGNSNLKWETSKQTDLGINFGVLNDRITGQVAYYNNNVDGLILYVNQAPSAGLPTVYYAGPPLNVGSMYNRGLELNLNATAVQSKDFTWTTGFNLTINNNKVTGLADGLPSIQTATSGLETVNLTKPGYALGYLWVIRTAGVDAGTGKRIFVNSAGQKVYYQYYAPSGQFNYSTTPDGLTKYVSPTGGTTITQAADAVMYKNPLPKYVGGWSNTFNYKGFTLDVLLTYQAGFYVYYGTNSGLHDQRFWNNATDILTDAWTDKGQTGKKYARPVFNDNVSNGSAMPLDMNVFKGDFIKLRTLSLSYNLPSAIVQRVRLSSARIYVSGQNLGIISGYPGPDPEVASNGNTTSGQGVDRNTTPNARTITVGLNVGF